MRAGVLGPDSFGPTPVASETGHARPLEETLRLVRPLLRRIPITRVVNVTPLDFIGLPVWSAITPLARDLTVHGGKGRNALASQLSAIMEAVERVSAEELPAGRSRAASFADIQRESGPIQPLDPEMFDLPFETRYAPDLTISWVLAYDLIGQTHYWVPADLVISPAREGVCLGVETNGLAAGNNFTEATLHALFEVIERNASSLEDFCDQHSEAGDVGASPPRMIDPESLPAETREWTDELFRQGLRILIRELDSDLGIPAYSVLLIDEGFPGAIGTEVKFGGYGCDLEPGRAVFRAVTEAIQSHTLLMLGARDTFEGQGSAQGRAAMLLRRAAVMDPGRLHPFPRTDRPAARDLYQDLQATLAHLKDAGLSHCLVADLTRADLEFPVVRVLVPGLAPPYGETSRRPSLRLLRRLVSC